MWKKGFARIYTEKMPTKKAEKESGKSERGKPLFHLGNSRRILFSGLPFGCRLSNCQPASTNQSKQPGKRFSLCTSLRKESV